MFDRSENFSCGDCCALLLTPLFERLHFLCALLPRDVLGVRESLHDFIVTHPGEHADDSLMIGSVDRGPECREERPVVRTRASTVLAGLQQVPKLFGFWERLTLRSPQHRSQ